MNRDRIRLSRRHQAWLHLTFGILFLSGVLWLIFHFFVRAKNDFGDMTHPAEPWLMKLHGGAAMIGLIVLGTLLPGHVRRAWDAKKNRFTGSGLLALNALLIITGYALYYCAGEQTRPLISALHWIFGLVLPITIAWHIWQGGRLRQS